MPDTRLILHVKGTEAETREVPKEEVRAGLSQGKFSQTQLIWSPSQNAWKQAKEYPELSPEEQLILHVKGTESETRQLPKPQVRAAISHGEITHSQLIWSPAESAWKQVRELPELLPSQKLAPAPEKAPEIIPESPTGPVARAAVAVAHKPEIRPPVALTGGPSANKPTVAAATPKVRVASGPTAVPHVKVAATAVPATATPAAGAPKIRVAAAKAVPRAATAAGSPSVRANATAVTPGVSHEVKEEDEGHPLKWLCIGLGTLIVLIMGLNYILVDLPLRSKFGQTSYANVTVHAHFGAFFQPNVMVIHVLASTQITPENLPDVLIALSHSTPDSAVTRSPFARIALTSGWTAQYSFSGESWKQLTELDSESAEARKEFLLAQLDDAGGDPVVKESTLSDEAQQAQRDEAWKKFVADFTAKH